MRCLRLLNDLCQRSSSAYIASNTRNEQDDYGVNAITCQVGGVEEMLLAKVSNHESDSIIRYRCGAPPIMLMQCASSGRLPSPP